MDEMSVEQQIGSLTAKLASLDTKVENVTERAKEDRLILNEIRDLSKGTNIKMEGVEKGFADGAAEFAKIREDIKGHGIRITALETQNEKHTGIRGFLNSTIGQLLAAATLAVLAWTAFKMH